MIAPRASPTAIAEPRSRPARDGRPAARPPDPARSRAGRSGAGTSGDAVTGSGPLLGAPWSSGSDLEQFGLLVLDQVVDLVHVAVGGVLELLLRAARPRPRRPRRPRAMRSSSSFALRRMLRMATLASSPLPRATFTSSRRRSSVSCGKTTRMIWPSLVGLTPEVGVADGLLDGPQLAGVVGLDDRHARLGNVDRGQLVERRHRAVVVDDDPVEHRAASRGRCGRCARSSLATDGLLHLLLGVEEGLVDHGCSLGALQPRRRGPARAC